MTSGFIETIERRTQGQTLFVDKSLFIKDLVKEDWVTLILKPPGFGKSFNFQMGKQFLAAEYEIKNNRLRPKFGETKSSIYFRGGFINGDEAKCFQKLQIANDDSFYKQHQGQHPVLYLSFKSIDGNDLQSFKKSLKAIISDIYRQHKYLFVSKFMTFQFVCKEIQTIVTNILKREEQLRPQDIIDAIYDAIVNYLEIEKKRFSFLVDMRNFKQIVEGNFGEDNFNIDCSISNLIKRMSQFYDKRVIILVDDYDSGIIKMAKKNAVSQVKKAASIISKIIEMCDGSTNSIFIAGRTSTICLDFSVRKVRCNKFQKYGFTQKQVELLVRNTFGKDATEETIQSILIQIKRSYNCHEQVYSSKYVLTFLEQLRLLNKLHDLTLVKHSDSQQDITNCEIFSWALKHAQSQALDYLKTLTFDTCQAYNGRRPSNQIANGLMNRLQSCYYFPQQTVYSLLEAYNYIAWNKQSGGYSLQRKKIQRIFRIEVLRQCLRRFNVSGDKIAFQFNGLLLDSNEYQNILEQILLIHGKRQTSNRVYCSLILDMTQLALLININSLMLHKNADCLIIHYRAQNKSRIMAFGVTESKLSNQDDIQRKMSNVLKCISNKAYQSLLHENTFEGVTLRVLIYHQSFDKSSWNLIVEDFEYSPESILDMIQQYQASFQADNYSEMLSINRATIKVGMHYQQKMPVPESCSSSQCFMKKESNSAKNCWEVSLGYRNAIVKQEKEAYFSAVRRKLIHDEAQEYK